MGYVKIAIACGLFVAVQASSHTLISEAESAKQRTKLQHVVIATEVCRDEAETIVLTQELDAKQKHGVAIFYITGVSGDIILVKKETFADYYVVTCFSRKASEDPVLNGTPDIAAKMPTT